MRYYYFPSTHWDREWYMTFQEFRKYLVDTAELIVHHLNHERGYEKFCFDGQTIVLDDITELRPSLKPALKKLVKENRLKVGPWYVMPDEFLVSLEALVRNFQIGRTIAKEYGNDAWDVCYICDIFGHSAQFPQIVNGFGQRGAVVWRGFPIDCGPTIRWEAPDGTSIPALRLIPHDHGYCNFSINCRGIWSLPLDEALFRKKFEKWYENASDHYKTFKFLCDACDHCQPAQDIARMFEIMKELHPDAEIQFSDIDDVFDNEFNSPDLNVIKGEQLVASIGEKKQCPQISATLSSRYDVKFANDTAQSRMELEVEPQAAMRILGGESPLSQETLLYAWKEIIQNHAHDSICGCSIDQVHADVLTRFRQAQELIGCCEDEFAALDREQLSGLPIYQYIYNPGGFTDDLSDPSVRPSQEWEDRFCSKNGLYTIRVFSGVPGATNATHELVIPFPTLSNYPKKHAEPFCYEFLNSFRIFAEDGTELPYTVLNVNRRKNTYIFRSVRLFCDLYKIAIQLPLKGGCWQSFYVKPSTDVPRFRESMLVNRTTADNGILRLSIHADGTFDVLDHRSGRCVKGYNQFHFNRDIGDGWNHIEPAGFTRVCDTSTAQISITCDGPARTAFAIKRTYTLPKELVFAGTINEQYAGIRESDVLIPVEVTTHVALDKNADMLDIHVELDNTLKDFRLRMEFPTAIQGSYFVSQCGAILQRNCGRENGSLTDTWWEPEHIGRNADGIVAKRDDKGIIAILTKAGIHEAGGLEDEDGTLFVTLMRAFRRTVGQSGSDGGQLNKHLDWYMKLAFASAETTYCDLYNALQHFRETPLVYMLPTEVVRPEAERPAMPSISLDGQLAFSSLKPAMGDDSAVILRLINLSDKPQKAVVSFDRTIKTAQYCRLDETVLPKTPALAENAASFTVEATPWQFVTVRIVCGK